jgi:hypothetical protein
MLKAGVMGCRRTDPYCENLKFFQVYKMIALVQLFIKYKSSCLLTIYHEIVNSAR